MLYAIVLLVLAIQPSQAARTGSRPSDDLTAKLNKHASDYNLGVFNFIAALIRVSNDFQIPMGIAWVNSPTARAELPFAWKDATVFEIIQAITKTQPNYQVQVENGVLHVFPVGLIPDRENFLKLRLGAIEVHEQCIEVASFKLHMLVTPIRGNRQVSIAGPCDSRGDVELKDAPVEAALDSLVASSNRKIWVVTFSDDSTLTSRGLRRAGSLWTEKLTPDQEQPSWDLLRWGDPMPPLISGNSPAGGPNVQSSNNLGAPGVASTPGSLTLHALEALLFRGRPHSSLNASSPPNKTSLPRGSAPSAAPVLTGTQSSPPIRRVFGPMNPLDPLPLPA